MNGSLLVVNAGSSSLKFSLFALEPGEPVPCLRGRIEELHGAPRFAAHDARGRPIGERRWPAGELPLPEAVGFMLDWLDGRESGAAPLAVGHRVVHGGTEFADPVRIDAATIARLEALTGLAPLHQPANLVPMRVLGERLPDALQVACFDTAFHRSQPELAQAFALPARFVREGVRRYGFHGLSYEYVAAELARIDPRAADGRTVVAHLGAGASMCALRAGRSMATTMGFTALDGLPMGTRCGAIDPGVLLWLMDEKKMGSREIERLLYHESGLLGVSGLSSDLRELLASDAPAARRAVDLFVYRIGRELGSLAAALGGLDALVFTAGIGENAPEIRARVCRDAAWLGIALDEAANASGSSVVSAPASRVSVRVVATDEERMIALHTLRLLRRSGRSASPAK
jgi:acetate kinase